jgi:UDP-N-acetylglucosamine transferase subunit ALG13
MGYPPCFSPKSYNEHMAEHQGLAEKFGEVPLTYANNPVALHLKTMNML